MRNRDSGSERKTQPLSGFGSRHRLPIDEIKRIGKAGYLIGGNAVFRLRSRGFATRSDETLSRRDEV
jgi:hypothetical protein